VPQDREADVFGTHARSIVADQDAGGSAVVELDLHARGGGVQSVFDQLLDH
jgi:hypothetical protein